MIDQLENVLDQAAASQPTPNAETGAGVRDELAALTAQQPTAPTAPVDGAAPRVSRKGETWDAAIHVDPPSETARGTWRKRNGAALSSVAQPTTPEQAAQRTLAVVFGSAAPLLDRFAPLPPPLAWAPSDDERNNIEDALERFYAAHPEYMVDLPPGVSLVLAVAAYALPRVAVTPIGERLVAKLLNLDTAKPPKKETLKNEVA